MVLGMETIKVKARVGGDGILKLELPVGITDTELEVVVVMQPLNISYDEVERAEWLAFIEKTAGILAGDPIERSPQGD